ncbi:MAG: hydroxymethylbilane synthase [Dehalococcoidia bacterium]|nr:hydroxymethylbilane synthase [Dehalococcoidia bacterium]
MTTGRTLIVGTRGSRLARRQTESVVALLKEHCPDCRLEVRAVRTTGDLRPEPLSEISGEGVFTKELETALLAGEIDIAVHSLKDLPTDIAHGLAVAAVTRREDPRDALVSRDRTPLAKLPRGARIGTGSVRRAAQLRLLRPDVKPVPIRGNVDTRLAKVESGEFDAVIVAAAALSRLGWLDKAAEVISLEAMLPAPGQGALAVETRADDAEVLRIVATIDDRDSRLATAAERAFLRRLGGGCRIPVAALATVEGSQLHLDGLVVDPQGIRAFRGGVSGDLDEAESLGERLAASLLSEGASEILEEMAP